VRRPTDWFQGPGGVAVNSVSATGASFVAGTAAIQGTAGETIIRIRGRTSAVLLSATSDGDGFAGALGIGITSAAAITVGVGSVPTPITEASWDGWLWHSFVSAHSGLSAEVGGPGCGWELEIDSKAMRKLDDPAMSIYGALEFTEIGAATMSVFFNTRVLALH